MRCSDAFSRYLRLNTNAISLGTYVKRLQNNSRELYFRVKQKTQIYKDGHGNERSGYERSGNERSGYERSGNERNLFKSLLMTYFIITQNKSETEL